MQVSKWEQMLHFLEVGPQHWAPLPDAGEPAEEPEEEPEKIPWRTRSSKPYTKVAPEVRAAVLLAYRTHLAERQAAGFERVAYGFLDRLLEEHRVSRVWFGEALRADKLKNT